METYISILRGINVSGQKKINMNELRDLFAELKYKNIRTYIQSGNIIFSCNNTDHKRLSKQIEQKILEKFKFEVPVLIRTHAELSKIIDKNPFVGKNGIDIEKLHVTFLSDEPKKVNLDKTNEYNYEPDRFLIYGREVYVYCPNGYGRTKLNNNFFENKLNVTATTRNLRTVNELFKFAEEIGK